jgi:hypothetical protein
MDWRRVDEIQELTVRDCSDSYAKIDPEVWEWQKEGRKDISKSRK